MQSWHDQPLDEWPQHVTNTSRRDNLSRPSEKLSANLLLLNWFCGFKTSFKQVLVSTRFTAMIQINSLKYKWHQLDKLAYNSRGESRNSIGGGTWIFFFKVMGSGDRLKTPSGSRATPWWGLRGEVCPHRWSYTLSFNKKCTFIDTLSSENYF